MTVQCIRCQHFSLRTAGQMARQGYGHCELAKRRYEFQSATFQRHCSRFEAAGQAAIDQRRVWLAGEREKFLKEITT